MTYAFEQFCCCPHCRSDLNRRENALDCLPCKRSYPIENGIAILMPQYGDDDRAQRYHSNYESIAHNFLDTNKYVTDNVAFRHLRLVRFMGRRNLGRVLDVGSSHGAYLNQINAEFKVAFDIARTYLDVMKPDAATARVQGDAEYLPFKTEFFDTIILADIMEHIQDPKRVVNHIYAITRENTRIFVHIPWEESLEPYLNSTWEFSHLRSFNAYKHAALWHQFSIVRAKETYPDMRYPLLFQFERMLPTWLYDRLVRRYFFNPQIIQRDAAWRKRRLNALPRGEWWLLWLFDPVFKMYEMRVRRRRSRQSERLSAFIWRLKRAFGKVFRSRRSPEHLAETVSKSCSAQAAASEEAPVPVTEQSDHAANATRRS